MILAEYTKEAYLHIKNNDIDNLQKYLEDYINNCKNIIIANSSEFCDFNYIQAMFLYINKNFNIAKDYISAAMISYKTSHLCVEFQDILSLYINICGELEEYNQIIKIFETYKNYDLNNKNVLNIIYWMNKLNFPNYTYAFSLYNKLKVKFNGSAFIINNFSKLMQDMFILTLLNGKRHGKYIELGVQNFNKNNNTFLLETLFSWEGISIEYIPELVKTFNNNRKNKCIYADATKLDYDYLIKERLDSNRIDYLQVDLGEANISLEALKKIVQTNVRFSIITFAHNKFADYNNEQIQEKVKELLKENGYICVVKDINAKNIYTPCEDWYIDSQIMNEYIINTLNIIDENYTGNINTLFYVS